MASTFQIKQFAATGIHISQDNSMRLITPDNTLTLIDMTQGVIKPGECYLVTISKIGSEKIIIEGDTHVEEKSESNNSTSKKEDQETSVTDGVSGD